MGKPALWALVVLPAVFALVSLGHSGALAEEPKKIRDNSFLLEEAYNQEPGVIQHIQAFRHMKDKSWNYTFTEEWPVPRETHQLSLILPTGNEEKGLGNGAPGIQVNIPASIEVGDKWVTHWNLGMTYLQNAKGPGALANP